jgi:hypothetical protein
MGFGNYCNPFANGGGGGGASSLDQMTTSISTTYADLPDATLNAGKIFIVLQSSGVWLINRKEAGMWRSDGVTWTRLGSWLDAFKDGNFTLYNTTDNSKMAQFSLAGLTTLTTRTYTLPDQNGTIALTSDIPDQSIGLISGASMGVFGTAGNVITINGLDSSGTIFSEVSNWIGTSSATIWTSQDWDDTSQASTVYVGKTSNYGDWKVTKSYGTTPVVTDATVANNPLITLYATAWTNRLTLTYN